MRWEGRYFERMFLVPSLHPLSHLPQGPGPGKQTPQTPGFVQYDQGQGFEACSGWPILDGRVEEGQKGDFKL